MSTHTAAEDGALPPETRAIARLPGLDIAIVHTAAHAGQGESVTVMVQRTGTAPAALDPMQLWMQLAQAAWHPWLTLAGAFWGVPLIRQRR